MNYSDNPSPRTTGYANASIILSLASIVLGPFGSVPGIVCGHKALSRMRKNPAIDGYGRALAGTILGYCFLVLFGMILAMFFIPLLVSYQPPSG